MKNTVLVALGLTFVGGCMSSDGSGEPGSSSRAGAAGSPAVMSASSPAGVAVAAGAAGTTGAVGIARDIGPHGETTAMFLIGPHGERTPIKMAETVPEPSAEVSPIPNALSGCTVVTGAFITGTNAMGSLNTASVNCPAGQVALGITATWSFWTFTASCTPVTRRSSLSGGLVDWFSTPSGSGTGCQSNQLAAQTVCCTP